MFDDARELVVGKMRQYCEHKGTRIDSSVQYSPLSNEVADRVVGVATNSTRAMLRDSNLPGLYIMGRGDDDLHVTAQEDANEGATP